MARKTSKINKPLYWTLLAVSATIFAVQFIFQNYVSSAMSKMEEG